MISDQILVTDEAMKKCASCHEWKPKSEFHRQTRARTGLKSRCRVCTSRDCGQWYQANRLKAHQRNRTWAINNPRRTWAGETLRKHKGRGCEVKITRSELADLASTAENCQICGLPLSWSACDGSGKTTPFSPTLDRIDNLPVITLQNTQIVHHRCNTVKGGRTMEEFLSYCRSVLSRYEVKGLGMTISQYDANHIYEILFGEQDWFGAQLIRLIGKADEENREAIRRGFPEFVEAFEMWDRKTGIYEGKHDGELDE